MRKGLWSPDEDQRLVLSVAQYVTGSWSEIARKAGLDRCGKSCRRRWMNHLRPHLKRGKFSMEEINLIVELQEVLGNRWSNIATHLQGRTDNDVKNVWNTQIKKRLPHLRCQKRIEHPEKPALPRKGFQANYRESAGVVQKSSLPSMSDSPSDGSSPGNLSNEPRNSSLLQADSIIAFNAGKAESTSCSWDDSHAALAMITHSRAPTVISTCNEYRKLDQFSSWELNSTNENPEQEISADELRMLSLEAALIPEISGPLSDRQAIAHSNNDLIGQGNIPAADSSVGILDDAWTTINSCFAECLDKTLGDHAHVQMIRWTESKCGSDVILPYNSCRAATMDVDHVKDSDSKDHRRAETWATKQLTDSNSNPSYDSSRIILSDSWTVLQQHQLECSNNSMQTEFGQLLPSFKSSWSSIDAEFEQDHHVVYVP